MYKSVYLFETDIKLINLKWESFFKESFDKIKYVEKSNLI